MKCMRLPQRRLAHMVGKAMVKPSIYDLLDCSMARFQLAGVAAALASSRDRASPWPHLKHVWSPGMFHAPS